MGMVAFYVINHMNANYCRVPVPLIIWVSIACVFELYENHPLHVANWSMNGGDTIANSVSDMLWCWLGWVMCRYLPNHTSRAIFWSILAVFGLWILVGLAVAGVKRAEL